MIISQVKFVTPEMAKEWLEKYNNVNRTLNMDRAKFYRDIILQGKWETTHQGISFFENGELPTPSHFIVAFLLERIMEIQLTERSLLSKKRVVDMTSLSYPTIWRMMKKGTFPKSVSASNRRVAWVAKDIEKWLAERG